MNIKRMVPSVVAVVVFIFVFEWLFHGMLLGKLYEATKEFWRMPEHMIAWAMMLGQLLFGFFVCVLYATCCRATCLGGGVKFGFLLGLMLAAPNLILYAVQPLPAELYAAWAAGAVIEMTAIGAILGAIYRPCSTTHDPA